MKFVLVIILCTGNGSVVIPGKVSKEGTLPNERCRAWAIANEIQTHHKLIAHIGMTMPADSRCERNFNI